MTKTITLRDDVYNRLLSLKREGESFSELFERLSDGADPLETLRGLRGCVEFRDKETMLSEINGNREERRP